MQKKRVRVRAKLGDIEIPSRWGNPEKPVLDPWVIADPYVGGAHLPDITLVAPVDVKGIRVAYVATRAHHSDVGGM